MSTKVEKVVEFVISETGGVILALQPFLPFHAEQARLDGGHLVLTGNGRSIRIECPADVRHTLQEEGALFLREQGIGGAIRETDLLLED